MTKHTASPCFSSYLERAEPRRSSDAGSPDGRYCYLSALDDGYGPGKFVGSEPSRAVSPTTGRRRRRTGRVPCITLQYHGDPWGHYSARMVTDGRWKLVWNLTDLCELYDLENDPHELQNRFYDPACEEVRTACFDYLLAEARRTGDAHVFLLRPEIETAIQGIPVP